MKIACWNVNSLKVRLPHLIDWLAANPVDAICLQETKLEDKSFPHAELAAVGYRSVHNGRRRTTALRYSREANWPMSVATSRVSPTSRSG